MGVQEDTGLVTVDSSEELTSLEEVNKELLNQKAQELINKIVQADTFEQQKELTQLFNQNQAKKTVLRTNKYSQLLDTITDQALARFTSRPDEISNKELIDGLKTVQDLMDRGQQATIAAETTPLIQINQQEVNVNGNDVKLNRESRERVKQAVLGLLTGLDTMQEPVVEINEEGKTENDENQRY